MILSSGVFVLSYSHHKNVCPGNLDLFFLPLVEIVLYGKCKLAQTLKL